MHVVALDTSMSSAGWARWWPGLPMAISDRWVLAETMRHRAAGFVSVHQELKAIHDDRAIDLVCYETPAKLPHDKVENLVTLYGIVAHVESYCKIKEIRCIDVTAGKWRETYLGKDRIGVKGRVALKRLAVLRGRQLGFDPATDDEAEAIGILDHTMHKAGIIPPWRTANPLLAPL